MILTDILSCERVGVDSTDPGIRTKDAALQALAELLAGGQHQVPTRELYRVLAERETLQSTGIGNGVAIPHGATEGATCQVAAVLVCPRGVPFDAADGRPVRIFFAVVGPKRATGEHLKILARVSRLLRDSSFREKLVSSATRREAFDLIRSAEEGRAA